MFSAKELKKMDKDDLLHLIGLETRKGPSEWLLPALGAFSVGLLVGAGVGLLMAQKPGDELLSDLRNRLPRGQDEMQGGATSQVQGTQAPAGVARTNA